MTNSKFNLKMNINKYQKKLVDHLRKNMNEVMVKLVAYVKDNFGPSNLGGKNPSSPGSTPNIGQGTLRNSITFNVIRDGKDVVGIYGVRKGPADEYAKRLELGFVGTDSLGRNINQQARPFLRPAYRLNKRKIVKILGS
jgi:hypothetical protein